MTKKELELALAAVETINAELMAKNVELADKIISARTHYSVLLAEVKVLRVKATNNGNWTDKGYRSARIVSRATH